MSDTPSEAPKGPYKLWAGYTPASTARALTANEPMPADSGYEPDWSTLYLGYGSNLSPRTMKQRCPDSLFIGLARLHDWKWTINSTQYANVIPSPGDVVYGGLYFLSKRDEAMLDQSEGVPWLYEKRRLKVIRISEDGEKEVEALTYVDVQRQDEGKIEPDYVVWVNKAIREASQCGLPADYVKKYLRPYTPLPPPPEKEQEIAYVRVMKPMAPAEVIEVGGLARH